MTEDHNGFAARTGINMDTYNNPIIIRDKTPANAGDTGTKGEICWDASYIYVCTATDTWKRVAIATW